MKYSSYTATVLNSHQIFFNLLNSILLHEEHPVGISDVRVPRQKVVGDKIQDQILFESHSHNQIHLIGDPEKDGGMATLGECRDKCEIAQSNSSFFYLTL